MWTPRVNRRETMTRSGREMTRTRRRMDSMEITKMSTAALVAGIAFFLTGLIGSMVVHPEKPHKAAIEIKGAVAEGPAMAQAAPLAPIEPLLAAADPAAGEATYKKLCISCHTVAEGGKAGVGPNLYGVVGSTHGRMAGFNYSAGLKEKTGNWTYEELNQWLKKPGDFVKGTRMAFAGLSADKARADVIVYLRGLAKDPVPLPAK